MHSCVYICTYIYIYYIYIYVLVLYVTHKITGVVHHGWKIGIQHIFLTDSQYLQLLIWSLEADRPARSNVVHANPIITLQQVKWSSILLMEEILPQLRLVVYPIIYWVLNIPNGAGFLPSTVLEAFPLWIIACSEFLFRSFWFAQLYFAMNI